MRKKWMKLGAVAFVLTLAITGLIGCKEKTAEKAPAKQEITVLSFGGEFTDAQRFAYFSPFEKETGIKVTDTSYNGEYGKLKATVESGNVPWDVVDIDASALMRGIKENLYMPINYKIVDKAELLPDAINDYAVATDFYSVSLGYNTKSFPEGKPQPADWKDFWNVKKFPGARCLKKDPRFTLEIALLADGVPMQDLYGKDGGLDLDRAFKSLDKIKPYVKVWWTSGHQPIQLLSDGEVAMVAAFGARLWNAQHKDKKPVAMTWNQGIIDIEYFAVLKGAKKPDLSMKFINFASTAEHQAEFPKHLPLGPVNKKAFEKMGPALAKELNTYPDNLKKQAFLNAKWWAEHESEVIEKWNAWLAK